MAGKLASTGSGKTPAINSEPNVIPFIDIMLVLLIIFMVAAPLPTVDIKVDLPPPGRPVYTEPTDKPTTVGMVDLGGNVSYFIEGVPTPRDRFQDELLRVARERNPSYSGDLAQLFSEAKVFVDADQETSYNNVIELINEIDQAGFKKVSLLVKEAAI
ncbi:MAG: biopolymer transporter ExbD [Hyphomonadaceae bacterium]|nr:biopolymer transporter ExbD [Hyphomonadaceae bacterium]